MTRGKYAARSAQKRAEAAEITSERFAEEMLKWKKVAQQNKELATQALAAQRELREWKKIVGVPESVHNQAMADLEHKHKDKFDNLCKAVAETVECLQPWLGKTWDDGDLPGMVTYNFRNFPKPIQEAFAYALGWPREVAHNFAFHDMHARLADAQGEKLLAGARLADAMGDKSIFEKVVDETCVDHRLTSSQMEKAEEIVNAARSVV